MSSTRKDSTDHQIAVPRPYLPGSEGIWTFVLIDMIVFLLIFFVFMSERLQHQALYIAGQQQLKEIFGLANTLLLLTSSWMVATAVRCARMHQVGGVTRSLGLAFVAGLAFAVSKVIEYHGKIAMGITPASSSFFTFYFFITIVHFLHVLIGMLFIFHFRRDAVVNGTTPSFLRGLENVGVYWHFVDVLWIFIFPLLYLVGRR